jgi:Na+/H+ antiporter NhaD/arsenite permease-like protein
LFVIRFLNSNIGGTATAIGDPPNILLVSDQRLQLHSGGSINFGQMTLHLFPCALLVGVAVFFLVRIMFVATVRRGGATQASIHELGIWRRTAARIAGSTPEERQVLVLENTILHLLFLMCLCCLLKVREELMRHIAALEKQMDEEAASATKGELKHIDISELEQKYVIRNWPLFINSSIILGCVVVLFFLHSFVVTCSLFVSFSHQKIKRTFI